MAARISINNRKNNSKKITAKEGQVFVNCPLCAKDDYYQVFSTQSFYSVVKCRCCKLMYVNPRSSIIKDTVNTEGYYKQYINAADAQKVLFNNRFKEFLSEHLCGKVLDVGCATGNFLTVAKQNGWDAIGIDVSQWACNYLQESGFENIFHTTLEKAKFPDEYFNAVHLSHVLEHVQEPNSFLTEIYRVLKPKGRIIIEVPNESRFPWNYKLIRLLQPRHTPKYNMSYKHLFLFTPNTMRSILLQNGFTSRIIRSEGFSAKGRMQAMRFQKKTLAVFILKLAASLNLDVRVGFGRYIVAMAEKDI